MVAVILNNIWKPYFMANLFLLTNKKDWVFDVTGKQSPVIIINGLI